MIGAHLSYIRLAWLLRAKGTSFAELSAEMGRSSRWLFHALSASNAARPSRMQARLTDAEADAIARAMGALNISPEVLLCRNRALNGDKRGKTKLVLWRAVCETIANEMSEAAIMTDQRASARAASLATHAPEPEPALEASTQGASGQIGGSGHSGVYKTDRLGVVVISRVALSDGDILHTVQTERHGEWRYPGESILFFIQQHNARRVSQ